MTTKTKMVEHKGMTFELREKGDWKWFHLYLPFFVWIAGIFSKEYKRRWYEDFWTVVAHLFKKNRAVLYGPVGRWSEPGETLLDHEARHSDVNPFLYVLWARYRLAEELDAYETQMMKMALKKGYVEGWYLEQLTLSLYKMYILWPFMRKKTVRRKVRETADRVEARARIGR